MSISGDASWIDQSTYKVALTTQAIRLGKISFDALPPVAFQAGWKQTISGTNGGILRVKFGDDTNSITLELVHGTSSTYNLYHNTTLISSVSSVNIYPGSEVVATYKQVNAYVTFKLNNVTIFNEVDLDGKVLTYENGVMEAMGVTYANQNTTQTMNDMFLIPITEFQNDVYIARGIYAEQYFNLPSIASSQWKTSGNNILYDGSGNVGIGTTPYYTLDVSGNINLTGDFYKNNVLWNPKADVDVLTTLVNSFIASLADVALSGDYNDLINKPANASQWTTNGTSIYYNGGNVGIGKITPIQKLDVSGNINFTGDLYKNGTLWTAQSFNGGTVANQINVGNANGVSFLSTPVYQTNGYYTSLGLGGGSGGYCLLFKNDANRTVDGGARTATLRNDDGDLKLQSKGGIGISINQNNGYVTIERNLYTQRHIDNTLSGGLYLNYYSQGEIRLFGLLVSKRIVGIDNDNLHIDAPTGYDMYLNYYSGRPTRVYGGLYANNSDWAIIAGNPNTALNRIVIGYPDGYSMATIASLNNAMSAFTPLRMRGGENGYFIQLGSANSGTVHECNAHFDPYYDNTWDLGAANCRWRRLYVYNSPNVGSDRRLKRDIRNSPLGLDFINDLRPVCYKMIEGDKKCISNKSVEDPQYTIETREGLRLHFGLIAQEVKEAVDKSGVEDFSGWCLENKEDPESSQSLAYESFIAPMIKAIQELSSKNKALEDRIALLEEKLNLLLINNNAP